eukprot:10377115-Alexandrium_andersonii.AAC.1
MSANPWRIALTLSLTADITDVSRVNPLRIALALIAPTLPSKSPDCPGDQNRVYWEWAGGPKHPGDTSVP